MQQFQRRLVFTPIVFLFLISAAFGQTSVPATGLVFTSREHGDQEFRSAEAACSAFVQKFVPGSTFTRIEREDGYQLWDPVRCLYTDRDGNKQGYAGVHPKLTCPANSSSVLGELFSNRQCECDSGLVAKGGKCVSSEGDERATGKESEVEAGDRKATTVETTATGGKPEVAGADSNRSSSSPVEICFDFKRVNAAEMQSQLKGQENAINAMAPGDLLERLDLFTEFKRPDDKGDRQYFRRRAETLLREHYEQEYSKLPDGKARAAAQAKKDIEGLDATHSLDWVAGGDGDISGLGDSIVNQTIGRQWKKKRAELIEATRNAFTERRPQMNVRLTRCAENN